MAVGGTTTTPSASIPMSEAELQALAAAAMKGSKAAARTGNTVAESGGQTQSDTSPSGGARETVKKPSAYEEVERTTNERLLSDPEYCALKAKYDTWNEQLMSDFNLVDQYTGIWPDKRIQYQDLVALENDTKANPDARAAAHRLLENRTIWQEISKDDCWVGVHDVENAIAGWKSELKSMRDGVKAEVTAEVKAERAAEQAASGGGPKPGAANGTASNQSPATGSSPEDSVPKPPPSTKEGLDGTSENLANTADYLQQQMMALADDASKNPANATLNAQKIAMLQNKFQAITNMMNQLTQMLSNMSKMWSDVAMNSIRNLK